MTHSFVFLCFIKPILGNRYGPGVSSCQQTSGNNLGVAGSAPSTRAPGLPIRDCARGRNNRAQMCAQLSAIDVTERTFFERLYLVLGLRNCTLSQLFLCIHNPDHSMHNCFSIFVYFFSPNGPSIFCYHDSPSNLAESLYPPLHLNYIAGYTHPLLFLFQLTQQLTPWTNRGKPWRLRVLAGPKFVRTLRALRHWSRCMWVEWAVTSRS